MRISARLLVVVLLIAMAEAKPILQSPKGAEMFPMLVIPPQVRMTIVVSNAINSVNLIWNASVGTNVAGYFVYWGTVSRSYQFKTDSTFTNRFGQRLVRTNANIGNLTQGIKYYFSATAYSPSKEESDYSNEASYTLPFTYNTVTLTWSPPAANVILASTDLISWRVFANVSPPLTFLRTNRVEFYRLRLP